MFSIRRAGSFPRDLPATVAAGTLRDLMKRIREVLLADPSFAGRMRRGLASAKDLSGDPRRRRLVEALIRVYEGSNNRYIDYYGPPRTVTTIPYHEALQIRDGAVGERKFDLKDKIVFVGLSESMLAERKDSFYTVFSRTNGIFIGGVEISATAFSNMLEGTPVHPLGFLPYALIVVLWGFLIGAICRYFQVGIAALPHIDRRIIID